MARGAVGGGGQVDAAIGRPRLFFPRPPRSQDPAKDGLSRAAWPTLMHSVSLTYRRWHGENKSTMQ
jgi:hypothetical protein